MAFTWNGVAKASVTGAQVIAVWPWLVKKFDIVADSNTAEEALHGEDRAPDVVLVRSYGATPQFCASTQTPSVAATMVKLDAEGAENYVMYMIWFSQSSGGLTNVS